MLLFKEFALLMKKIIAVVIVVLISACSGPSKKAIDLDDSALESKPKATAKKDAKTTEVKSEIDPDVLYMLLIAEIAGQRQQYGIALDGYLEAAKQVSDPKIAERAAKIAVFLKQNDKADEAVSLWLQYDNESLTARKIAVVTAFRGGDEAEAVQHLNFLLKVDPAGFETALIDIVKLMEQEGKASLVFDVLEIVSNQHPDNATVFYVQAFLAMRQKKFDLAQQKIQYALDLQPDWTKALILKPKTIRVKPLSC